MCLKRNTNLKLCWSLIDSEYSSTFLISKHDHSSPIYRIFSETLDLATTGTSVIDEYPQIGIAIWWHVFKQDSLRPFIAWIVAAHFD